MTDDERMMLAALSIFGLLSALLGQDGIWASVMDRARNAVGRDGLVFSHRATFACTPEHFSGSRLSDAAGWLFRQRRQRVRSCEHGHSNCFAARL